MSGRLEQAQQARQLGGLHRLHVLLIASRMVEKRKTELLRLVQADPVRSRLIKTGQDFKAGASFAAHGGALSTR